MVLFHHNALITPPIHLGPVKMENKALAAMKSSTGPIIILGRAGAPRRVLWSAALPI